MILKKRGISAPFLKNSIIALVGTGLISFLNYLFHLVVARLLSPSQYGVLQSFIALTYFFGVFVGGLSFSIIHSTASIPENLIWPTVRKLENKFVKISVLFFLGFLAFTPLVKNFLHLEKIHNLLIFSLYVIFFLLPTIYQSVFQARLKFLEFSILGILATLAKNILAFLLILWGFEVAGALIGIVISGIVAILVGRFWIAQCWQKISKSIAIDSKKTLARGFWQYSFLSLVTNLFLVSAFSSDILLVRHFFSSSQAGIYSAVSVLGKIIFFAASSILLVAFPSFVKYKNNKKKLRQSFLFSFLFLATVCIFGFMSYKLFPETIVRLLYNRNYFKAIPFLFSFAIFISLFAIFNLLIQLLLSQESQLAAWLAGLAATSQIVLIIFRHANLEMVITNSIISLCLGLLLGLLFVKKALYEKRV